MRKKLSLLPVLFLLTLVSCKKSNSGPGGSGGSGNTLSGTWNFIYLVAHSNTTVDQTIGNDEYQDITISNDTTEHNTGTISFNNGVEKESGVSYESIALSEDSSYEDGRLMMTTETLNDGGIAPTSGSAKYQLIGSDSLYYPAGGIFTVEGTGVSQTTPVGSIFSFHGDTLVIMTTIHQVTDESYPGQPATQTIDATSMAYFLR